MADPFVVTARFLTPAVGLDSAPVMLDGPLAWAAAMDAHASGRPIPPITPDHAPDLDLPLERWEEGGTWGWCTSAADLEVVSWTGIDIRRKPATGPMARFTTDRRHHSGLGPYKARDTHVPAVWVRRATWHVLATDRDRLEELLTLVTHLGGHRAIGHGRVEGWTIEPGTNRQAWRDRPMPEPGAPRRAYRAPYHHPTRQVEVTC